MHNAEVHVLDLDGLPVFHSPRSGPVVAALLFRVGVGDEPAPRRGICHVIEHLALSQMGEQDYDFNGEVDHLFTRFDVRGTPAEVGTYLTHVTAQLASLDVTHLERERNVLRVEAEHRGGNGSVLLASLRWGATGIGAEVFDEYGLATCTPNELAAFAADYFTRDNAALVVYGDLPEGFVNSLPTGTARTKPPYRSLEVVTPAVYPTANSFDAFSVLLPPTPVGFAASQVLQERLTKALRHDLGLSYHVGEDARTVDAEWEETFFAIDSSEATAGQMRSELVRFLETIGDADLTGEADTYRRQRARRMTDPDLTQGFLYHLATQTLLGVDALANERLLDQMAESFTDDDLRTALREALATMILVLPEAPESTLELTEITDGRGYALRGDRFTASFIGKSGGARELVVGDEGVSYIGEGEVFQWITSVRWEDLAVAERDGRTVVLKSWRSEMIMIDGDHWRDGNAALTKVRERVPPELWVTPFETDDPTGKPMSEWGNAFLYAVPAALIAWLVMPWWAAILAALVGSFIGIFAARHLRPLVRRLQTKRVKGAIGVLATMVYDTDLVIHPNAERRNSAIMRVLNPYGPHGKLVVFPDSVVWRPAWLTRRRGFQPLERPRTSIAGVSWEPAVMTGFITLVLTFDDGTHLSLVTHEGPDVRALFSTE